MTSHREVDNILGNLKENSYVQKMKKYTQHGAVSTFEHCENVAKMSYKINRAFLLRANLPVLLTAAMLHDFYLYDWHKKDNGKHRFHGYTHADRACKNARRYLQADEQITDVIYCHMWPLNIRRVPHTKEACIVCLADKIVSLQETLFKRNGKH